MIVSLDHNVRPFYSGCKAVRMLCNLAAAYHLEAPMCNLAAAHHPEAPMCNLAEVAPPTGMGIPKEAASVQRPRMGANTRENDSYGKGTHTGKGLM
jgi:hypothetical protein